MMRSKKRLCFGWIDGQMQSIDGTKYRKYFYDEEQEAIGRRKTEVGAATYRKVDDSGRVWMPYLVPSKTWDNSKRNLRQRNK